MRKLWTADENKYLHDNYANNYTCDVATALGRSEGSVYNQAFNLQLKKSSEHHGVVMAKTSVSLKEGSKLHRYAKGHVPANKGNKVSAQTYSKCAPTMFKKGNKPHNYKPIGSERLTKDGYLERKVAEPKKWKALHIIFWEEANGPVPTKHKVMHLDRNPINNNLENLICVSYGDAMRMNSIVRYPADLRFAMKKLKQLKKLIENGKEQN